MMIHIDDRVPAVFKGMLSCWFIYSPVHGPVFLKKEQSTSGSIFQISQKRKIPVPRVSQGTKELSSVAFVEGRYLKVRYDDHGSISIL